MDAFDSNDDSCEQAPSESDLALWRLLGRSPRVEVSPYFVRKVLREIETAPQPVGARWLRLLVRTIAPTAVCAGIAVLAIAGVTRPGGNTPPVANADIEFETIQNLDLLVSNYESSIWLDPSSSLR